MANFPEKGIKYFEKNIQGTVVAEAPASFGVIAKGACTIGFLSYAGSGTIYNTDIGRFCSLAPELTCGPTNHPTDRLSSHLFAFNNYGPFKGSAEFEQWVRSPKLEENSQRVKIGNDVWIGRNVVIKRGVVIGDGAIIGAGSVVAKDVPPYAIVGGVPAKLIRYRFTDDIIERLTKLQWHNYRIDRTVLPVLDMSKIEYALDVLEQALESGVLKPLTPKRFKIAPAEFVEL